MCSIQTIFIIITKRQYGHHHTHKIKVAKCKKNHMTKIMVMIILTKIHRCFDSCWANRAIPQPLISSKSGLKTQNIIFLIFFRWIFMIRWQMTNPGIFHTDWKGFAWIKINKIFFCNNFSKYFCALHIVFDKGVLLLYVIFHYYIFSRGLFPNKLVAFVFHDGVGGQVFDSLKVLGRKYGNLITVITKLILYNHCRFSQYSNFKQFFSE